MYIPPNTTIYILENIPLNSEYENTVYYPDEAHQVAAFQKYKKFTLTDYSYQRANSDCIKVEIPYEKLYTCNYMMYKNTNFEDKWIFCFIENVSYVSNDVTAIYFKEDVMQTWCYNYTFLDSFVDRRHETNDYPYKNLQPEGLQLGSYYKLVRERRYKLNDQVIYCIIISDVSNVTFTQHTEVYRHGVINGVYNGLYFLTVSKQYGTEIGQLIENIISAGKENAVTAFYEAPTYTASTAHFKFPITYNSEFVYSNETKYKPKNKKLYSSPFHILQITNNCGASVTLNPEQIFDSYSIEFDVENVSFPNAGSRLVPTNYNGVGNRINYSIIYLNYPICSFSGDSFKLWWSQNKNSYLQSLNAIDASYDANQRIAQNNYDSANRSARATNQMSLNSASNSLAASMVGINKARWNLNESSDYAQRMNSARGGVGVAGDLLTGNFTGAASSGLNAQQARVSIGLQQSLQSNTLSAQQAQAEIGSAATQQNAQIAYENTLRNNAVNKANSNLSNLTSKTNAINALMAKKADIQNIPNTAKLNASADTLNWAYNEAEFYIGEYILNYDYLKMCDDYFTAYGYNQSRLFSSDELNNRINRKHFSFLKTVGCNIRGNLNDQDSVAIRSIYDNGITTWDTLEDVGDYSLDN